MSNMLSAAEFAVSERMSVVIEWLSADKLRTALTFADCCID